MHSSIPAVTPLRFVLQRCISGELEIVETLCEPTRTKYANGTGGVSALELQLGEREIGTGWHSANARTTIAIDQLGYARVLLNNAINCDDSQLLHSASRMVPCVTIEHACFRWACPYIFRHGWLISGLVVKFQCVSGKIRCVAATRFALPSYARHAIMKRLPSSHTRNKWTWKLGVCVIHDPRERACVAHVFDIWVFLCSWLW